MDRKWENKIIITEILPQVITNREWKSIKKKSKCLKVKLPATKVVFSNTNTRPCYTKEHCFHDLKKYQDTLKQQSKDIPFNFLIGKDGNVYEGTGWKCRSGDTKNIKAKPTVKGDLDMSQINIAFINDKDLKPSTIQAKRAMGLLIQGIQNNYVSMKMKIVKDQDCRYLFSKSDFKNTMLELMGQENDESESDDDDEDSLNKQLLQERIEAPFNYLNGEEDDPDELEYEKLKHTIREHNPDFF